MAKYSFIDLKQVIEALSHTQDLNERNALLPPFETISISEHVDLPKDISRLPNNPITFETTFHAISPLDKEPHSLSEFNSTVESIARFTNCKIKTFGPNARFNQSLTIAECPIVNIPDSALPKKSLKILQCPKITEFKPKATLTCTTQISNAPVKEINIKLTKNEVIIKRCKELTLIQGHYKDYLSIHNCPNALIDCHAEQNLTIKIQKNGPLPKFGPNAKFERTINVIDESGHSYLETLSPIFNKITPTMQDNVLKDIIAQNLIKKIIEIFPTIKALNKAKETFSQEFHVGLQKGIEALKQQEKLAQMLQTINPPENER
jgi:hypothetical protein